MTTATAPTPLVNLSELLEAEDRNYTNVKTYQVETLYDDSPLGDWHRTVSGLHNKEEQKEVVN